MLCCSGAAALRARGVGERRVRGAVRARARGARGARAVAARRRRRLQHAHRAGLAPRAPRAPHLLPRLGSAVTLRSNSSLCIVFCDCIADDVTSLVGLSNV